MPCEACGWAAAFASCLAFGSFGVPIKSKAAREVDIDPLVFQSYKTFMCFLTSWIVLAFGEPFTFSWWGIVSGLFWVPSGTATVYAVKSAGLAIGIGIGSSFIVLVSFIWGIGIFEERVHSRLGACFAIFCLMSGLFGMSYYSAPTESMIEETSGPIISSVDSETRTQQESSTAASSVKRLSGGQRYQVVASHSDEAGEFDGGNDHPNDEGLQHRRSMLGNHSSSRGGLESLDDRLKSTDRTLPSFYSDTGSASEDLNREEKGPSTSAQAQETDHQHRHNQPQHDTVDDVSVSLPSSPPAVIAAGDDDPILLFGGLVVLTKRRRGMLSAMFCGLWGGSILVPMKWCESDTSGVHYLISFAIGASVVTVLLWILRFSVYTVQYRSPRIAYEHLPSFHLRVMWLPGGLSGLLWSIGNFFSLISVNDLGEGVGYPLVQTSILVSGLWGLFYFHEVTGPERIAKWFASSLLTIFGILLLSYEHHEQ